MILHGPSGSGKTSAVYVMKHEMNLDLIELNTSDVRDSEAILRVVGNAASSQALFSSRKLILIDEAENIKGSTDSGGMRTLAAVIKETQNPIVLIANDYYKLPDTIRRIAAEIKFNTLKPASIRNRLREIADAEHVSVDDDSLEAIASMAGGDMRAAINDLESLGDAITPDMIAQLAPRDAESSIFEGLSAIFKQQNVECRKVFYDIDKPPDEILYWVDENMPRAYEPHDRARAYYYLSRADVFLGRVRRRQYYRFWAYAMDLMTGGVSVSRRGSLTFSRYESPSFFKALGRTKTRRKLLKAALLKIGAKTHSSSYDAQGFLPLLRYACAEVPSGIAVMTYFELEPEELEVIAPATAKEIVSFKKKEDARMEREAKKRLEREERLRTKEEAEKGDAPKPRQTKKSSSQQTSLFQF
jgi:replication factor C large subunit